MNQAGLKQQRHPVKLELNSHQLLTFLDLHAFQPMQIPIKL